MRVESKVDPDQMALSEASWSGSTVFSKKDKSGFSRTRINSFIDDLDQAILQGSYWQDCVKFKDFSRTSKILSYCFQGLKI